jgi:hypothetical protein
MKSIARNRQSDSDIKLLEFEMIPEVITNWRRTTGQCFSIFKRMKRKGFGINESMPRVPIHFLRSHALRAQRGYASSDAPCYSPIHLS